MINRDFQGNQCSSERALHHNNFQLDLGHDETSDCITYFENVVKLLIARTTGPRV